MAIYNVLEFCQNKLLSEIKAMCMRSPVGGKWKPTAIVAQFVTAGTLLYCLKQ